jgi:hypothetical protein
MRLATWLACAAVVLAPFGVVLTHDRIIDYKIVQAFSDLGILRHTIKSSGDERHHLPSEAEGLQSLAEGSAPLLDRVPDDPWHHPYVYRRTSEAPGFVVYSRGADGVDDHGAGDDITTPAKSYRCETYYDDCAGTLPWWRNVALAASFLGGVAWLAVSAVRAVMRRARRPRRA